MLTLGSGNSVVQQTAGYHKSRIMVLTHIHKLGCPAFVVYAACIMTCWPFIDFHSTNTAPMIESAPAATET
jgi:hypothetical protein